MVFVSFIYKVLCNLIIDIYAVFLSEAQHISKKGIKMSNKHGYIIIGSGNGYLKFANTGKYQEFKDGEYYRIFRSENFSSVSFTSNEFICYDASDYHSNAKIPLGTKIYTAQISGVGAKFSTNKSIIDEVKKDFHQLVKVITGENKTVNLSNLDIDSLLGNEDNEVDEDV